MTPANEKRSVGKLRPTLNHALYAPQVWLDAGDTLTLKDLAKRYGISKERVRQIEKEALQVLNKSVH
ncbi:MAG TPA: hypothetical protein DEG93_08815 [Gammaproteobacteria bacterium]|nr:hypothetical protein [Gammaproteobacteria bacterium]